MTARLNDSGYRLPEVTSRRIFEERIVPDLLSAAEPADAPVVVFVAGQPGAGKTAAVKAVRDSSPLASCGGSLWISSDFYKPYHPDYDRLITEEPRNAAEYVGWDGREWMAMALHHAQQHRLNVVMETTMRDDGTFLEPVKQFRAAHYRVEATLLAVHKAHSRLGILSRYLHQVEAGGRGRLTDPSQHDRAYNEMSRVAMRLDREGVVDMVRVERRGGELLYANNRNGGGWKVRPAAFDALRGGRNMRWTHQESLDFVHAVRRLAVGLSPQWLPDVAAVAELADPLIHVTADRELVATLTRLNVPAQTPRDVSGLESSPASSAVEDDPLLNYAS